jgi:ATP-dependent helicase/DNAse subunit B
MDDRLDGGGSVLPVFLNRDGTLAKKSSAASLEDFEKMRKRIGSLVRDTALSIAGGNIRPVPLGLREPPCQWCGYRAACHFDDETGVRRPCEVME